MTMQECYEAIDGNYNEIMSRLHSEDRIRRFLDMFLKEQCYNTLVQTLKEGRQDEAFRAAHTLKGICQNLSFTSLFQSSNDITEALRANNMDEANGLLNQVTKDYERTTAGVRELLGL